MIFIMEVESMVKRPMLFILISYVTGSCLYDISVFLCLTFCILLACALFYWWNTVSKNRHDHILVIVPFFFLLGFVLMNQQQKPGPLDDFLKDKEQMVTCEGEIAQIQATQNSNRILLQEVTYGKEQSDSVGTVTGVKSKYLILYASDITELQIGNRVKVYGKLSLFLEPTNLGQFNERLYYKIQNIDYKLMVEELTVVDQKPNWFRQGLHLLRQKLIQAMGEIATEDTRGSLQAMILGEKGMLDEETKSLYQVGGLSHILAISGLHVSLLGMALYEVLLRIGGVKVAVLATIIFIIVYGILTNFSVSTNRAVVMMMIMLLARIFGKTYDLLSAVSLSAILILIKEPMQIYQSGFLLSYGAVIGVGVVNPYIQQVIRREHQREAIAKVVESIGFFIAIQLATLPILLFSYYQIPTYAILLNLLILPFMSLVVILGLLGAVVGCVSLPVGMFVISGAVYILQVTRKACELVNQLPMAYVVTGKPSGGVIVCYVILICLGILFLHKEIRMGVVWIGLAVVLLMLPTKTTELTITMLDVGQGDGIFIENVTGTTYLIDGGSSDVKQVGKYRLLPFVKARGHSRIDYILVSHGDSDHISGVLELLEAAKMNEIEIGTLLLPDTPLAKESCEELLELAKEVGSAVVYMKQGDGIVDGELKFQCLHPTYDYVTESENDASMVLKVVYGQFSMLFTGDMEAGAEERLLRYSSQEQQELQKYDVLKVAHHGSKYSTTTAFLERIRPTLALISAGKKNRYGHPHQETLERIDNSDCQVIETKESGAIEIVTDGEKIWVEEFLK